VLLVEKNSQAGGGAMVISKNGFTYEMWPVIHAPARSSRCLQVLRELGVEDRVELAVPEVRGGIYFDAAGEVRRFPNDPDPDGTKILHASASRTTSSLPRSRRWPSWPFAGGRVGEALDETASRAGWSRGGAGPVQVM
jgi:protoporphyrinogen oxidase